MNMNMNGEAVFMAHNCIKETGLANVEGSSFCREAVFKLKYWGNREKAMVDNLYMYYQHSHMDQRDALPSL